MKFLYADSLDYVDSKFDFIEDSSAEDRKPYWDDSFTHEMHNEVPYSGLLISRSVVGDPVKTGRYTQAQSMYFRRVGARKFLRLEKKKYSKLWIMGDCGAFNYHKMKVHVSSINVPSNRFDDKKIGLMKGSRFDAKMSV